MQFNGVEDLFDVDNARDFLNQRVTHVPKIFTIIADALREHDLDVPAYEVGVICFIIGHAAFKLEELLTGVLAEDQEVIAMGMAKLLDELAAERGVHDQYRRRPGASN